MNVTCDKLCTLTGLSLMLLLHKLHSQGPGNLQDFHLFLSFSFPDWS